MTKESVKEVKFYNGDVSIMKSQKSSDLQYLRKQNEELMNTIERLQMDMEEYLDEQHRSCWYYGLNKGE